MASILPTNRQPSHRQPGRELSPSSLKSPSAPHSRRRSAGRLEPSNSSPSSASRAASTTHQHLPSRPTRRLPRRIPVVIIPSIPSIAPPMKKPSTTPTTRQIIPPRKRPISTEPTPAKHPKLSSARHKRPRRSGPLTPISTSPTADEAGRICHSEETSEDEVLLKPTTLIHPSSTTKLTIPLQLPSPSSSNFGSNDHHPQTPSAKSKASKPKSYPHTEPVRRYSPSKRNGRYKTSTRPISPTPSPHRSPNTTITCLTENHDDNQFTTPTKSNRHRLGSRSVDLGLNKPSKINPHHHHCGGMIDESLLDQIESMINQTQPKHLIFQPTSSSIIDSNPRVLQLGPKYLSEVDERCFEVIKNTKDHSSSHRQNYKSNHNDDDDDDDNDEGDEDRDEIMKRLLSDPNGSPRRLSSVSPLEPANDLRIHHYPQSILDSAKSQRKSPRKINLELENDHLAADSNSIITSIIPSSRNNKVDQYCKSKADQDLNKNDDDGDGFSSEIVLPHLNGLLNHLSGLNPLPIRIPSNLSMTTSQKSKSQSDNSNSNKINHMETINAIINQTPCLIGLEDVEIELRSILFRTIHFDEGNVLILSGPRASGKSAIISRSLSLLKQINKNDPEEDAAKGFITIRLNGLIHTNDKIVLKEICRQLFSSLSSTTTNSSNSNNHDYDNQQEEQKKKLKEFEEGFDFDPPHDENEDDDDEFIIHEEEEQEEDDDFTNTTAKKTCTRNLKPTTTNNNKFKFSNYGEGLKNLLNILEPTSNTITTNTTTTTNNNNPNFQKSKSLIFILEEFDKFSDLDVRQSFLYCLLDSVQGSKRQNGIFILGTTSVTDCLDKLEKRVKSRCQSRIRYLDMIQDEKQRVEQIKTLLELHPSDHQNQNQNQMELSNRFIELWNSSLDRFLSNPNFLNWLNFKFNLINHPLVQILQDLNGLIAMIVYRIKRTGGDQKKIKFPILKVEDIAGMGVGMGRIEQNKVKSNSYTSKNKKLLPWWAQEMSSLELTVLISCKHLTSINFNGIFNLEMAWDSYRQHLKRLSFSTSTTTSSALLTNTSNNNNVQIHSQVYGREAFELGWERLKKLEILITLEQLNQGGMTGKTTQQQTKKKNSNNKNNNLGNRYQYVKLIPFLNQLDQIFHYFNSSLSSHLRHWYKNSSA